MAISDIVHGDIVHGVSDIPCTISDIEIVHAPIKIMAIRSAHMPRQPI